MLLLAVLAGCGAEAAPAFERPPAPVRLAVAETRDVPVYLDEIGRCVARETVSLQPQVSGRITGVHFADGADVKAGEVLFTLDARPFEARVAAAQAALTQAQAKLDWSRLELDRATQLGDTRAIAQSDIDARRNAVDVAQAEVQGDEAELRTAQLDLEYCTLRSPLDGRVGQRLADPGNVVKENEGTLVVIERLDPLYVDFTVAENDLSSVQREMAAGALSVEVRLPDEPTEARGGELTFLDNSVQGSTGTVKLRATIPNADRRFWPGRFVKVRLVLSTLQGAVLVPAAATQMSANGPFVYVVGSDETAELRPVQPGQRQDELLVIAQGLQAGERVVVEGQLGVTPGGKVHEVDAAPPAAAAPGPASP
ncbi:MAG TPA: efflux RND transporter periplasmic adaptor subunit [Planctomycetota bacterium]|nr:efflux RND transporter periplasmic adaptor subunit [Planctomycetota bacterium]